jgi:competence protein ComGC
MSEISTEHQKTVSEKNSCGVFGLVLSIIGICFCGIWLFSIPGLILSMIGLRKEPRKAATAGAIIGGVGTIAFLFIAPLMLGIMLPAFATAVNAAKQAKTHVHILAVQNGSDAYHADHQKYPSSFNDLENGSYILHDSTQDAWGKQMQFKGGGDTKPTITSAGEDGEFGTEDDVEQKNN